MKLKSIYVVIEIVSGVSAFIFFGILVRSILRLIDFNRSLKI